MGFNSAFKGLITANQCHDLPAVGAQVWSNVMYKWNHTGSHPGTLHITLPFKIFKKTAIIL